MKVEARLANFGHDRERKHLNSMENALGQMTLGCAQG